jgi:ribosomal-protein-alanine N-acetyltransferase
MTESFLSVREIQEADIDLIANYWLCSEPSFLKAMGVDLAKLPSRDQLSQHLLSQINTPIEEKRSYCIIWEVGGKPVGHCNTNPTVFGEEAYMHLHLWQGAARQRGIGTALVKMTLPYFFQNLKLKKLLCEPYALNVAPNKTLMKIGFNFIKEYTTIPGSLNFEQSVRRWELTCDKYQKMQLTAAHNRVDGTATGRQ